MRRTRRRRALRRATLRARLPAGGSCTSPVKVLTRKCWTRPTAHSAPCFHRSSCSRKACAVRSSHCWRNSSTTFRTDEAQATRPRPQRKWMVRPNQPARRSHCWTKHCEASTLRRSARGFAATRRSARASLRYSARWRRYLRMRSRQRRSSASCTKCSKTSTRSKTARLGSTGSSTRRRSKSSSRRCSPRSCSCVAANRERGATSLARSRRHVSPPPSASCPRRTPMHLETTCCRTSR
mmetsp:Transcript_47186/g.100710  ORF Transcript_47186/g.100710 Transcript_47186/m.100710 type:complete len:238 (-) Transcript_47186:664-1377(-)